MYGVSVCVVNSHLAAHDHNQLARVEGYNTILGSHIFAQKVPYLLYIGKHYRYRYVGEYCRYRYRFLGQYCRYRYVG